MLFQRILQNTIHDHFRRQKVRNTWTTLLSAFGKGDEKDDDYDILETLSAKSDSNATVDPAKQFEQGQIVGMIEQALMRLPGASTRSLPVTLLGRTGRGGSCCRDGLFRGKRQDPLFPRRPCLGRDAQGQGVEPMTTQDDNFSKKLTGYLDIGAAELKAGTVYRLQNARAAALARLAGSDDVSGRPNRAWRMRSPAHGGSAPSGGRSLWTSARLWLGIAIIVAAVFGYQQWQAYQQVSDTRGTGRPDPVVGPAHRRVPRPGIPQLACPRRKLTAALGLALGLAVLATLALRPRMPRSRCARRRGPS